MSKRILTLAGALTLAGLATIVLMNLNRATEVQTERWVDLAAELVVVYEPKPGPNDPGRCVHGIFIVFPDVPGATQYRGTVHGDAPAHDVRVFGPPFPHDAGYYVNIPAGAGTHQVFVAGGSGGRGCGQGGSHAALFSIESMQVYTARPSIQGKVVDLNSEPVSGRTIQVYRTANVTDAPCAADPRPRPDAVGTTRGDGTYEIYVDEAEYEVCPEGSPFTPGVAEVSTEFIEKAVANFVLAGQKLSGTVLDADELPVVGATINAAPANEQDAPGAVLTGPDGTYTTYLAPGSYDVSAHLDVLVGKPATQVVDLTNGDAIADFELAPSPIAVTLDAPQPVGPGTFGFSANVVDDSATALTYEWTFGDKTTSAEVVPTHRYEKPGKYTVSLVVTNALGVESEPAKAIIEIEAPALSLQLHGTPTDILVTEVDGFVDVEATITASEDGVGPVVVDLPPSWLQPTAQVELVDSAPKVDIPTQLTLAPGESRVFPIRLQGVANGPFTLAGRVAGKDAGGRGVAATATIKGTVGSALEVSVTINGKAAAQATLELAEGADANGDGFPDEYAFEPKLIEVVVNVRNTTEATITHINLLGIEKALVQENGTSVQKVIGLTLGVRKPGIAPAPFPMSVQAPFGDPAIGELAPGEEVERRYTLRVENSGDFEISTLAQGLLPGTGVVQGAGAARLVATTDVALVVEVAIGPTPNQASTGTDGSFPPPRVEEGGWYRVDGRLVNVTTGETIDVLPIRIGHEGNGRLFGPNETIDVFVGQFLQYLAGTADYPTWAVQPTIEPRLDARFLALVGTAPLDLPSDLVQRQSSVVFLQQTRPTPATGIKALRTLPGGAPEELDPSRIRIIYGNGVVDDGINDPHLRVEVVPTAPREPNLSWDTAFGVAGAWFTYNAVTEIPPAIAATPGFLWKLGGDLWNAASPQNIGLVGDLANETAYLGWLWALTPEDQRQAILAEVTNEELLVAPAFAGGVEQAKQQIADGVYGYFNGLGPRVETLQKLADEGDVIELVEIAAEPGHMAGRLTGEWIAGEGILRFASKLLGLGPTIVKNYAQTSGPRLEEEAAERLAAAVEAQRRFGPVERVGLAPEVAQILQGREEANAVTAALLSGLDPVTFHNLSLMTNVSRGGMPIVIAARGRTVATLEWLKSAAGAALKPFGFAPKTVNEFDELVHAVRTGPPGIGGGDLGSAILAEPLPWDVVKGRIAAGGLSPEDQAAALRRWRQRWEEWYGVEPPKGAIPDGWNVTQRADGKLSSVAALKARCPERIELPDGTVILKGTFDVPLDGEIAMVGNLDTMASVAEALAGLHKRKAVLELRQVKSPPGSEHFGGSREYWEVWLDGKRVVGDVDLVHVAHLNGRMLDPVEAAIAASRTAEHGGQHWASSTSPKYREQYIKEHLWDPDPTKRGEPLLLFANGRAYFGYIERSFKLGAQPRFVSLRGTPLVFDRAPILDTVQEFLRFPLYNAQELYNEQAYVDPVSSLAVAPGIAAGPEQGSIGVAATRDGSGQILRTTYDGSIERWSTDGGWQEIDARAIVKEGTIHVAVSTGLRATAAAGTTTLEVFEPVAGEPWFQVGDTVVINPGGENEEQVTVVALGSLVLAGPTTNDHAPGEAVYMVAGKGLAPVTAIGAVAVAVVVLAVIGALVLGRRRARA